MSVVIEPKEILVVIQSNLKCCCTITTFENHQNLKSSAINLYAFQAVLYVGKRVFFAHFLKLLSNILMPGYMVNRDIVEQSDSATWSLKAESDNKSCQWVPSNGTPAKSCTNRCCQVAKMPFLPFVAVSDRYLQVLILFSPTVSEIQSTVGA